MRWLLLLIVLQVFAAKGWAENLNSRLDCYIESKTNLMTYFYLILYYISDDFQVNENSCKERLCIWDRTSRPQGIPICYIDTEKVGYHLNGEVKKRASGLDADLKVKDTSHKLLKSSPQIENLKLSVDFLTEKILRFKIFDPNNKRYEVPVQFNLIKKGVKEENEAKRRYSVDVREDSKHGFQLTVERKDTKSKMYGIFDNFMANQYFSLQF